MHKQKDPLGSFYFYIFTINFFFFAISYKTPRAMTKTPLTRILPSMPKAPPLIRRKPTGFALKIVLVELIIPLTFMPKMLAWRKFQTLWQAADVYKLSVM